MRRLSTRLYLGIAVLALLALACGSVKSLTTPTVTPTLPNRTFMGSGDEVIEIGDLSQYTKVRLTHEGSRNFIVVPFDGSNNRLSSLANEIGSYSGTAKWEPRTRSLEIKADGKWEIVVSR